MKEAKLYVPIAKFYVYQQKDNQKLQTVLSKEFERSVYWNEYKTKSENKNTTNDQRYFLESNFVGDDRLFVLVYTSQDVNAERFNARKYYLPNSIMRIFNIIINLKNFYDQPIDSHIKRNKEIRKLTTRQG